jgi:hypothetical protein
MQTLSAWIEELNIHADTYLIGVVDTGDFLESQGFGLNEDVWAVTLIQQSGLDDTVCRTMHVPLFGNSIALGNRQNNGVFTPPTALDVLDHMRSEASMAEEDFAEWAVTHFGEPEPSKTLAEWDVARAVYAQMQHDRDRLKWLIGEDRWESFLYATEED